MKKNIVIIGSLVLLVVLGYTYFWYKKNIYRAQLSKAGEVCYEKCRAILRENFNKCGENCFAGAPFFAYEKVTGKCVSRVNLENTKYYDLYVNDCSTNQYISRWNPSQEELEKLTQGQIDGIANVARDNNSKLLNNLIDLGSKNVEGSLLGP